MKTKTETIRQLNDDVRTGKTTDCCTLLTLGIQAFDSEAVVQLRKAVAEFDSFTEENDPYGEHDFGSLEFEGRRIFWKIDYYDKSLVHGSEDAANPDLTTRVLTIMLAAEY